MSSADYKPVSVLTEHALRLHDATLRHSSGSIHIPRFAPEKSDIQCQTEQEALATPSKLSLQRSYVAQDPVVASPVLTGHSTAHRTVSNQSASSATRGGHRRLSRQSSSALSEGRDSLVDVIERSMRSAAAQQALFDLRLAEGRRGRRGSKSNNVLTDTDTDAAATDTEMPSPRTVDPALPTPLSPRSTSLKLPVLPHGEEEPGLFDGADTNPTTRHLIAQWSRETVRATSVTTNECSTQTDEEIAAQLKEEQELERVVSRVRATTPDSKQSKRTTSTAPTTTANVSSAVDSATSTYTLPAQRSRPSSASRKQRVSITPSLDNVSSAEEGDDGEEKVHVARRRSITSVSVTTPNQPKSKNNNINNNIILTGRGDDTDDNTDAEDLETDPDLTFHTAVSTHRTPAIERDRTY